MKTALFAVGLLALLACAAAQNADDARALGEPGNNYCKALCEETIKRNSAYAKLESFCNQECNKCVDAVAKTEQGKKQDLPQACKIAYNFKEIPQIISEFQAGKLKASKSG